MFEDFYDNVPTFLTYFILNQPHFSADAKGALNIQILYIGNTV